MEFQQLRSDQDARKEKEKQQITKAEVREESRLRKEARKKEMKARLWWKEEDEETFPRFHVACCVLRVTCVLRGKRKRRALALLAG